MKQRKRNAKKSYTEQMREAAAKYGVKVRDASELGFKGIGIVGGVAGKQGKSKTPEPN